MGVVLWLLATLAVAVSGFTSGRLSGATAPNPDEGGKYQEGDLIIMPEQLWNPQNGMINAYYRWPQNTVNYAIDSKFTAAQRTIILSGLTEISAKTCIKFRERTTEADYVKITNDADGGCYSYIGCVRGEQQLNLSAKGGCVTRGVTMHEMLHVLGFFHSQSDTDRDKYVKINYENILAGKEHNFVGYTNSYVTSFDQPYDYNSILHYGAYAFTKNGLPTIELINSNARIGQRSDLSELDIKKVNIMYNCTEYL